MTAGKAMAERFATYAEFWPFYLGEHSRPATRALHYAGTGLGVACLITTLASQIWWLLAVAFVAGYGPAWTAHAFIEHNRPATFLHPIWSLVSDFRMVALWLSGRLSAELRNAGVKD
jgi:hypothetical protein